MFQFRLQRVLDLREKTEQEAATRLADARGEADAAREACARLEALCEDGVDRLAGGHGATRTVGQLQNLSYVVEHLNSQLQAALHVTHSAEENVRRLLGEFTTAFQERRVLDRLRERQHDQWKADAVLADRQLMDGIALGRFFRRGDAADHEGG